jgi:hypothetical protein
MLEWNASAGLVLRRRLERKGMKIPLSLSHMGYLLASA